jgi:hypothetical protein
MRPTDQRPLRAAFAALGRTESWIVLLATLTAICALTFGGTSCSKSHRPIPTAPAAMPDGPGSPIDSLDLAQHREAWAAAGRNSYTLLYRRWCFCAMTNVLVAIDVRENQAHGIEVVEDPSQNNWSEDELRRYLSVTIDDLFSLVEDALRLEAKTLLVAYDPERGYPEFLSIDYDEWTVDDEIVIQAKMGE